MDSIDYYGMNRERKRGEGGRGRDMEIHRFYLRHAACIYLSYGIRQSG